jgi:hypothetical protein
MTNALYAREADEREQPRRCIWCRAPEHVCVCFELDELRERRDDEQRERQQERKRC